jgi:hypothetical protein
MFKKLLAFLRYRWAHALVCYLDVFGESLLDTWQ